MAAAELLKESHAYRADVEVISPTTTSSSPSPSPSNNNTPTKKQTLLPRKHFNYILTTLVSNLEKTFTISPASEPLDGKLRLVHFGGVDGQRTMEIMMAAYKNPPEHIDMRWDPSRPAVVGNENDDGDDDDDDGRVGYEEVEQVKITLRDEDARWRKVCVDGTIVQVERDGWVVVRKETTTTTTGKERVRVLVDRELVVPGTKRAGGGGDGGAIGAIGEGDDGNDI